MKYNDRFLYFTYNGVHSSEFGLFYTNTGDNFTVPFASSRRHSINSPMYQDYSYWLGQSREPKKFKMEVAADGKTLPEIREIINWLDTSKPGVLSFDYDPYFKYNVVIESIDPVNLFLRELPSTVLDNIILFNITFSTIGENRAISKTTALLEDKVHYLLDTSFPYYFPSFGSRTKTIVNWENQPQHFEVRFSTVTNFTVTELLKFTDNLKTIYEYKGLESSNYTLNSRSGAVTQDVTGMLAERVSPECTAINSGPYGIEPSLIRQTMGELKTELDTDTELALDVSLGTIELNELLIVIKPIKDKEIEHETPFLAIGNWNGTKLTITEIHNKDTSFVPAEGERVNVWIAKGTTIGTNGKISLTYKRGD